MHPHSPLPAVTHSNTAHCPYPATPTFRVRGALLASVCTIWWDGVLQCLPLRLAYLAWAHTLAFCKVVQVGLSLLGGHWCHPNWWQLSAKISTRSRTSWASMSMPAASWGPLAAEEVWHWPDVRGDQHHAGLRLLCKAHGTVGEETLHQGWVEGAPGLSAAVLNPNKGDPLREERDCAWHTGG